MSPIQKALLAVVVVEVAVFGVLRYRNANEPALPEARKEALDPESIRELTALEETLPRDDAPALVRLGRTYRAFNLLDAAETCFREADRVAPQSSEHLFDWATTLSRLGKMREAVPIAERAIAAGVPEIGELRLMLARDRLREEDLVAAEKQLRELNDAPDAMLLLARLLVRTGRAREARTLLDQALQSAPDDFRARQMRAWVAETLGNAEEARQHRLIGLRCRDWGHRRDPISGRDYQLREQFARGKILARAQELESAGKWTEAAAALRQALALSWGDQEAARLAAVELSAGHPKEAIAELERLIAAAGASGENLLSLAQAWLAAGDETKAREYATKAEQLGANQSAIGNLQVQQFLGSLAAKRNDAEAARIHQARAQFELAKQSWSENNVGQAHQQLLRATTLWPAQTHAWFYLGETSVILGDVARARQSYTRCLELQPNHGRARAALERL